LWKISIFLGYMGSGSQEVSIWLTSISVKPSRTCCALIQHKTESPLSETVLRAAAEKAVFWARWDEVHLGQLRNSGTKTAAAYNTELAELALAKHCDGDTLGGMARWM
jgi:hypothetical protein